MNNMTQDDSQKYYQDGYKVHGAKFQRAYPNEELVRFIGRTFGSRTAEDRKNIKILEIGSGSCGNIWMLSREGFDVYGIDFSEASISAGYETLEKWGVCAQLQHGDMRKLPFEDNTFDVVIDIFSMFAIDYVGHLEAFDEVQRVTKSGGRFFTYHPSTESEAFTNHTPAKKLDDFTLNAILREDSPHFGYDAPFCFLSDEVLKQNLTDRGFEIEYFEKISKTYNNATEALIFLTVTGKKK